MLLNAKTEVPGCWEIIASQFILTYLEMKLRQKKFLVTGRRMTWLNNSSHVPSSLFPKFLQPSRHARYNEQLSFHCDECQTIEPYSVPLRTLAADRSIVPTPKFKNDIMLIVFGFWNWISSFMKSLSDLLWQPELTYLQTHQHKCSNTIFVYSNHASHFYSSPCALYSNQLRMIAKINSKWKKNENLFLKTQIFLAKEFMELLNIPTSCCRFGNSFLKWIEWKSTLKWALHRNACTYIWVNTVHVPYTYTHGMPHCSFT